MNFLVRQSDHVVVIMSEAIDVVSEGHSVDGAIYPSILGLDLFEVASVPAEVKPQQYCYTVAQGFYVNVNYVQPETELLVQLQDQIDTLSLEILQLKGLA